MKRMAWVGIVLLCSCGKLAKPKQESLLDVIPDKALAAIVVRSDAMKLVRSQLDDDPELQKELHEYLVQREGFDPSKVMALVVFVTAPDAKEGAAFMRMPVDGTPKWKKTGDADGVALYHIANSVVGATLPTGLLFGTEAGVRAAIATIQKKAPSLGKTSPLKAMLEAGDDAQVILGATLEVASNPQLKPAAALYGLEAITAAYSPAKVFVWADGQGAGLRAARDAAKGFIELGLSKLKEEKDKALAGDDTLEGASTILGYRTYSKLAPKVTPRMEGDRLVLDYALPQADKSDPNMTVMTTVAVAGVLAAVAVPAFMKYIRRSKTVEATMNVRRLFDAEIVYYEEHHDFVPSVDWTPKESCGQNLEGKCLPDPAIWQDKTWQALNFSVDAPFHYQYRVVKDGKTFRVEARGDLDGDGQFSLFRRTGSITPDGDVTGGEGLYSENDIE